MDKQQTYSPGLLYSIEPQDLQTLHLQDDTVMSKFDLNKEEDYSLGQKILNYIKTNTDRIIKT